MKMKKENLTCPVCGKPADFDAPPVGFFCSERCKLIDLGRWLGGKYQIPVVEPDESDSPKPPVDAS